MPKVLVSKFFPVRKGVPIHKEVEQSKEDVKIIQSHPPQAPSSGGPVSALETRSL